MPDYMYMLESRLSAEQRAAMMRVQELAAEAGSNVYLTGGAVRDLISGMAIRDLDFTVEGNPSRLARELEMGGAEIVNQDEKLRQVEMIFPGGTDGSISAAREDVYARPGTRPEIRWSTIMEDLQRRDFSINAVALSLNAASRGLLLDPTNGLADLENRSVRALSIHSFTNQPVRLLRAIRYCARMEFKLDPRTEEWFALALERGLAETIPPEDAGRELRQLAREDKPAAILKAWEARGLIGTIHPQLARRHPDYEMLARTVRARDEVMSAGLRPRLFAPVLAAVLGRLKARERAAALHRLGFRSNEVDGVLHLEGEWQKTVKMLAGRKTADPSAAYAFLEHTSPQIVVSVLSEASNSKAVNKVRNYLHKWRPLRQALPGAAAELETLGLAHGAKFDKVIQELFRLQLLGKGRAAEDRTKLLRKLAGIKEPPKKKVEENKKKKPDETLKKRLMDKEPKEAEPAGAKSKAPNSAKQQGSASPPPAQSRGPQGKPTAAPGKVASSKTQTAATKPARMHKRPAPRASSKQR